MKVTVTEGIRVVAEDGKVYKDGEDAEVSDDEGSRWVANGWASEAKAKAEAKAEAKPVKRVSPRQDR